MSAVNSSTEIANFPQKIFLLNVTARGMEVEAEVLSDKFEPLMYLQLNKK